MILSDYMISVVDDFLAYLEKERGYSNYTIQSYRRDLVRFISFCDQYYGKHVQDMRQIDKLTIRHFLGNEFEKGLSSKTVARRLATIKSMYKYLMRAEVVNDNPSAYVKTPKTEKLLPVYLNEKTIEKLMDIPPKDTFIGARDSAILELLYSTGIRLGELVQLNIGDIDFQKKIVKVMGKGGKERLTPFGNRAKISIENFLNMREICLHSIPIDTPLFITSKNKRLSRDTIQRNVRRYVKMVAEGTGLGPHILRHSFATHLMDRGADIRAVQELLGHRSLSSTQVYTHIQPEKMKRIHEQAHPHGQRSAKK